MWLVPWERSLKPWTCFAQGEGVTVIPPSSAHSHGRWGGSPGLRVGDRQAMLVPVTRQGPLPGAGPKPQRLSRSRAEACAVCGEEGAVLGGLFVQFLE